jgi:uncharacterized protein YciI
VSYFVVTREPGPAWDRACAMTDQVGWPEHAGFMNQLVAEGFVLLGGPVGGGERVLLVVRASSEAAIRARIATDPWTPLRLLPIVRIDPWQILLGNPVRVRSAS